MDENTTRRVLIHEGSDEIWVWIEDGRLWSKRTTTQPKRIEHCVQTISLLDVVAKSEKQLTLNV